MLRDAKFYSLTDAQNSIWQIIKFYPDTPFVNIAAMVTIRESVRFPLLNQAINLAIQHNDAMRIRIVETEQGPRQYISECIEEQFEWVDFSGSQDSETWRRWGDNQARERFKPLDSKLYDFTLIKISDEEGAFFLKCHHIIADAWSMALLVDEILANYVRLKENSEFDYEDKPSYADYMVHDQDYRLSERFERDRLFWNECFSTIPECTSLKNGKVSHDTKAQRETFILPPHITSMLNGFSKENGVSPFCVLLSCLTIYIWKFTAKSDVVIGTPVLNRSGVREKNTMGMFVNNIPFRIHLDPELSFQSYVKSIDRQWRIFLKHQRYPMDLTLKDFREAHGVNDRLFEISLSFQNARFKVHNLDFHVNWLFNASDLNSLTIHVNDREGLGNYVMDYDFLASLFSEDEISQIHESMLTLLDNSFSNGDAKMATLPILSADQEQKVLREFNDTAAEYPRQENLISLFERQVSTTPEKVAVVFENKSLTFRDLNARANQLARFLRLKGIKRGSIVGLVVDRSLELVMAILGVLKAGGAYLPIDPAYPPERIDYILRDSQCQLLLTYTPETNLNLGFKGYLLALSDENLYKESTGNLEEKPAPTDLAYVIYTSGSTGNPKGVMIEHKGLNNFVHALGQYVTTSTTTLSLATISFDLFFVETMFPLLRGMCVVLANREQAVVPYLTLELVSQHKVDFLLATPSRMKLLLNDTRAYVLKDVTELFIGGENFPQQLLNDIKRVTNARVLNAYGPTETSICATIKRISEASEQITIGKPIANTQIYILDQRLKPVPIGCVGEIFISGDGLAQGYLHNQELTRERFISNPMIPGTKMYKTGDLGRWLNHGEVEYLGRNDTQVKIRGLRIELGEIESCLLKHSAVDEVVVLRNSHPRQKDYLCAYLITKGKVTASELREHLLRLLPEYMIPAYFVLLETLPLSPNGKIDRNALPQPYFGEHEIEYASPRNALERRLRDLWEEALNRTRIGIDDNFFTLGGDSLAILEIMSGLFPNDWGLSAQDFYNHPTIRRLAKHISGSSPLKPTQSAPDTMAKEVISSVSQHPLVNINTGGILLTGATGFLGIHILFELLNTTDEIIHCLVRGKQPDKKLYRLLQYYFPVLNRKRLDGRLKVINGDISEKNFGLSLDGWRDLGQGVTRVVHAAALVSHYGEYETFQRVNVQGTQEVVRFCKEFDKKLNHISTISVSGNYRHSEHFSGHFTERDFYIGQGYKENVYVRTKFEAEKFILKAMDHGLNATIFRIGVLTGRYLDGKFQINIEQNALYRQLKAFLMLKAVPQDFLAKSLEFTPVDYCAKAVVNLIQSDQCLPVYHIFNHKTIPAGEMFKHFEAAGFSVKALPRKLFDSLIVSAAATSSGKDILSGIISELSVNGMMGIVSNIKVDSALTLADLRNIGFEWPEINYDYIFKVINYMQVAGFLANISTAN